MAFAPDMMSFVVDMGAAMMGTRYSGGSGDECDAFSRNSRRIISWSKGETHRIKARFWRRIRKRERQSPKDATDE